jgi:Zn-dependent protease with chaperone function
MFEHIVLVFISSVMMLVISSVLFSLIYAGYRSIVLQTSLNNRSIFILSFAGAALFTSIFSSLILVFPSLSGHIIFEHCHQNDCLAHHPTLDDFSVWGNVIIATSVVVVLIVILVIVHRISALGHQLAILKHVSSLNKIKQVGSLQYRVIESRDVFAWCAGLRKPEVFVSRGLLEKSTQEQLNIVLAHEHCHLQQRDNLRKFALYWLTLFWLPSQKKQIVADFNHSIEAYSDDYARRVQHQPVVHIVQPNYLECVLHTMLQSILVIVWISIFTSGSHFLIERLS